MKDVMRIRQATLDEVGSWDAIVRRFPNHRLPHTRAWIDALVASGCGQPLFLMLERNGEVVGALPGLVRRMGPLRMFGSPLAGWQTVSLGPAFDPQRFSTAAFASALVPYLEREHGVDHVEMMHTGLDAAAMRAAGFEGQVVPTFRAPLMPGNAAGTLKQLKDSARRNVRRAQRLGLTVRFEDDERFVDEHYDQVTEVYHRGGFSVPFSKQRVLEMFRRLRESGNLVALSVYLPGGRVNIATGLFFIEGKELLLWMWAHREHYRWYRPTELMTWAAMERAVERGCETFDLMGRGDFKAKFGAEPDNTKMRWIHGRHRWLLRARRVAEIGYRAQQAVRGRARKLLRRFTHRALPGGATPALVIGDADLVRALGRAGVSSNVIADEGTPARFSRHTRAVLPWTDVQPTEQLVDALVRWGEQQPEPPVLFYDDDRALLLVSRYRDRLREAFRFVVPEASLVEQLVDKAQFQALASKLKLPVPAARILHPAEQPFPADLPLTFPLALKPVTKSAAGWQRVSEGGKATSVATLDELAALWPKLAAARVSLIAQELIPGPETRIESYHVYVDERGAIAGEFLGRKIRTWPASYGDSTALETSDAADVRALGRELVKKLGLKGVAKFDFKRGPDDRLHLLEVNPRFNLWHHLGAAAGVNLPALVYADLTGQPRPAAAQARAGVIWCKPWKDIAAARAVGMSLARWMVWALRVDAMSAAAWDDPFPLIRAGLWRGVAALKRKVAGQFAGGSTGEPPLPLHVPTRSDV